MLFLQKNDGVMEYGVLIQSLAALRQEPFDRSEMTSQVIFGETFSIIEVHKNWLRVQLTLDGYEGWLDSKMCDFLTKAQMDSLLNNNQTVSTKLFKAKSRKEEHSIRLCPGSSLYNFDSDNNTFAILSNEYDILSSPFEGSKGAAKDNLQNFAKNFINSPYLWGGRSPYGVDCSGLVQVLYKMIGMRIPRDASQQVNIGTTVDFINLTEPGDLAFFDDEEGNITHVGMILPNNAIIHSSGYVKIDVIDHQGIFSLKTKSYSHKLRVVKRLLKD
jgi:gamma-D-glutamyl-L-lysine dipeptidyl-peptidase